MSEIKANSANIGLNLSSSTSQKKEGELTYALNAMLESWDGEKVNYQNELASIECVTLPVGYHVIGLKNVTEKDFTFVLLANPSTNESEIGKILNNECKYEKIINADCLNFSIERPVYKIHHKITNCTTEFYWRDPIMRWIDLENLPFVEEKGADGCTTIFTSEVDCNKLRVQPNFSIPNITYIDVDSGGQLVEGTYEFAVQYSNALGDGFTQYYGISNPISIFNPFKVTQDFNTVTDKSISFTISNLETSGVYDYVNIAVLKTINNITSSELVNTIQIPQNGELRMSYTGQGKADIRLTIDDIKERFPVYEKAEDSFEVQDVLGWADITTSERVNYQKIFNKLKVQWATNRLSSLPNEGYAKPLHTANTKGFMRDEVYPLEAVPLLDDGTVADSFHIPGRASTPYDLEIISNEDTNVGERCEVFSPTPRWKVYNTASSSWKMRKCDDTNTGQPFGAGTISLICSDNGCTQQGEMTVKVNFDVATPEPITLLLGNIYTYITGGEIVFKGAQGYDLYTIPPGVEADPYFYPYANRPFQLNVPAGVTSYTFPEIIYLQGVDTNLTNVSYLCQGCAFPVTDLYIKAETTSNYKITFTSPQPIVVNNIYPDNPFTPTIPPKEDCADECYEGLYEYGDFGYVESTELYPCDREVWGDLAGTPIRHHKFPDSLVSHIHDDDGYIYPMGIRFSIDQLKELIRDSDLTEQQKRKIVGVKIVRGNRATNKSIVAKGLIYNVGQYTKDKQTYFYPNYPFNDLRKDPFLNNIRTTNDSGDNHLTALDGFSTEESKKRYTFHSPDTHFFQPALGSTLKLETIEYGQSKGHFVQVKEHARYKFLTKGSYGTALTAAILVGLASNEAGLTIKIFDGNAAYAAFQAVISIIDKTLPRKNFAYQFNSLGRYEKYIPIQNNGNKVRNVDIYNYLIPGMTSAGDIHSINNYQRESSVYIRTTGILPFPQEQGGPEDLSRWTLSSEDLCGSIGDIKTKPISSYYASIKRNLSNQWGSIFSYEVVDTGFQFFFDPFSSVKDGYRTVFGGDIFINRFGLKRKLPFFIDNRVKFVDDSDISYNDLGNVANPTYWLSTDYKGDGEEGGGQRGIAKFFGVQINNFDCRDDRFFYQQGKFYLFAYGISYFFTESEVNVDMRQAFNDKEGDFFPHVGEDIPDDWLQEIKTTIQQDNTYFYNKTYSKQNKETFFSHIPPDFKPECFYTFPNRAVYSDQQGDKVNYKKNNWLIYRPISKFDFPLVYGKLTSIDGIENRAILARFENRSLIYNALITINTSIPQAAYLGNDAVFKSSPPLDFVDAEFNGSQHKMYLKTPYGGVSVDAKRGQVFIINGNKATEISSEEFKVDSFYNENLKFNILKSFPDINIDNHFNGIGITGVFDNKFNRLILTKLDYEPKIEGITYSNGQFIYNDAVISLRDNTYFHNRSFTMSFDFDEKVWVSFHSYIPNFYIGDSNKFYTGQNGDVSSVYEHYKDLTKYNNFFGNIEPYILEYPFVFKVHDEILHSISDYTRVIKHIDEVSNISTQNIYFNKSIIFNDEHCSGLLNLVPKPSNARGYLQYPKYNVDSKDILFTKSDSFYNYNDFWDIIKDHNSPTFVKSSIRLDKELNTPNLNYKKGAFNKYPIRGKDIKIRHILDNTDEYHLISQFVVAITQISYK